MQILAYRKACLHWFKCAPLCIGVVSPVSNYVHDSAEPLYRFISVVNRPHWSETCHNRWALWCVGCDTLFWSFPYSVAIASISCAHRGALRECRVRVSRLSSLSFCVQAPFSTTSVIHCLISDITDETNQSKGWCRVQAGPANLPSDFRDLSVSPIIRHLVYRGNYWSVPWRHVITSCRALPNPFRKLCAAARPGRCSPFSPFIGLGFLLTRKSCSPSFYRAWYRYL